MERTMMKQQIHHNFAEMKKLDESIKIKRRRLMIIPQDLREQILKYIEDGKTTLNIQVKTRQIKKFENLVRKNTTPPNMTRRQTSLPNEIPHHEINMENSVMNLSHRTLTNDEKKALQLGLNYALPYFKHKDLIIEAGINIELCLHEFDTNDSHQNQVRSGVARILHSEINKPDNVSQQFGWLKQICTNLKQDKTIKIVPADKGNMTVIMNTTEYENKIQDLLSAQNYSILPNDPTILIEKEIHTLAKNLLKLKRLDKEEYNFIIPSNSKIPRFYGLPKVHKENLPFRPMVDFLNSNYFTWKGTIYKQNEGTSMGSPISQIFAEFCLQELEEKLIINNKDIPFYQRFVDDSGACTKIGTQQDILQSLNSFHPSIQFTIESEENMQIPFLDVLLSRDEDGTIHKKVYRKPTHTGRYLNYHSYHHPSQKIAVIDALTYRALKICDDEFLEEELQTITESLKQNGYPRNLIQKRINRMKTKFQNQLNTDQIPEEKPPRIILPYMTNHTSTNILSTQKTEL
ncbi:uncharacterized protein LOC110859472 [Folsomia candida]|uniref:uncharacterized protein LOC110859472 n=1 Tax=Folsomia candida TaxID=158441 RepID=UPI000B8F9D1C|nr:uncharacterized protein LOC110859472 [Folsomia candida]